jgi:streptomycin 6-kinase
MNLPASFTKTILNTFGDQGRDFLASLPDLVAEAARRWQLTEIEPVPNFSYNFVAFARSSTSEVVLKLGVPNPELTSEITALGLFDGRGAVRLLDADAAHGMCLLERLRPGQMLASLRDDAQAAHIAADVMLALWRPMEPHPDLMQLRDWFRGFERLRTRYDGGTGPLDRGLVERAETASREFFAEAYVPTLIHGDLHHFNILSSGGDWLAIDPKGVIGPAAYEVGPLLINPWIMSGVRPKTRKLIEGRISILSERLGLEKQLIQEWGLAHAVLSAWWSLKEDGNWQNAIDCATMLASL